MSVELPTKYIDKALLKYEREIKSRSQAKKKANVETETEPEVPGDDSNKDFQEIMEEEMKKEGLTKFE